MNIMNTDVTSQKSNICLPTWDLKDLYAGMDAPEIKSDLIRVSEASDAFVATYKGRLAEFSGAELGTAIKTYEEITEILDKVMSYAQLLLAGDIANREIARFHQTLDEQVTDISARLLFFVLEINKIDESIIKKQLSHLATAHYASWIRNKRIFLSHQLDNDLERLLHEKLVSGRNAWIRLFEETLAELRFCVDDQELILSDALDLLSNKNSTTRKKAAKSIGKVLGNNVRIFSHITNTLAKDKGIEDHWRRYSTPVSARNLINLVEDEVVDALVTAVRDVYEKLSHRYYRLKAKWLGVERLNYWDRNAPLPDDSIRFYSWDEACTIVMDAYRAFSPELAEIAQPFFTKPWIDVPPRPGKSSGAFAHPTVPSAHPYLLLNFYGKIRDVMTLAHELGHGVHQILSAERGFLLAETPLTLSETASVFGEMLVFRRLLDKEKDPVQRRILLSSKVEDMINTVIRQIAFHEFEAQVHNERPMGELSAERLGEIWISVQRQSLGPIFKFDEEYSYYWTYISHFIHSPFYVYAYAFGDCLVNTLYGVFKDGHPDFQKKYLNMLSAGGTLHHQKLLAPFNLNARSPEFWHRGLDVISCFIDELEEIA